MKLSIVTSALIFLLISSSTKAESKFSQDVIVYDGLVDMSFEFFSEPFYYEYLGYYDCYSAFFYHLCCLSPFESCILAKRKNDKTIVEKDSKKFEEVAKSKGLYKKTLAETLNEELKQIKKDIVKDENASLDNYRKDKIYTSESLTKELQKNRILELEKLIQEKKQTTK